MKVTRPYGYPQEEDLWDVGGKRNKQGDKGIRGSMLVEFRGKGERQENRVDARYGTVFAGLPMIKKYLKRLIIINKEAILMEVLSLKGLMQLLMKTRNTDEKWTREEKTEMKRHLRNIAKIIPAVAIFSLPGGSFLLPILAEALDRRKTRRLLEKKIQG